MWHVFQVIVSEWPDNMTGEEPLRKVRRGLTGEATPNGQKVDNSVSTLQKLFQLYSKADLCDVQLQVGSNIFHAHKLILSMSSDVFKTMLTDAKWPDARKTRIVLNEEPECVQVFAEFLQYMYTGSIHLSNPSVLPVLTLADKYNIYDLSNVCKQYMADHCHSDPSSLKVVSWLQYAFLCCDHDLESKLRQYVELNFDHVMQGDDFLTMQQAMLEKMLLCEHLVIHSEFTLFLGLKRWLLHNTEGSSITDRSSSRGLVRKLMHQLMSHVRLPLMKQAQLFALASDPLVCQHLDFFLPKIATAWAFQSCSVNSLVHAATSAVYGSNDCLHKGVNDSHKHSAHADTFTDNSEKRACEGVSSMYDSANSNESCDSDSASSCHSPRVAEFSRYPFVTCSDNTEDVAVSDTKSPHPSSSLQRCQLPLTSSEGKLPASSDYKLQVCHSDNSLACSVMTGSSRRSSTYFTPRNYTCDDWSTCLAIEDFASFPQYSSHTYFFSTPTGPLPSVSTNLRQAHDGDAASDDEADDNSVFEWQVELYPKGVRFPHAVMIGIPNNYDIDEHCQDVVRLAVMSKTQHQQPCRVDISVLAVASGQEDGSEYMEALAHKSCIFDRDRTIHNIDNIVSYHVLNQAQTKYLTSSEALGIDKTCFKVVVIIKPS